MKRYVSKISKIMNTACNNHMCSYKQTLGTFVLFILYKPVVFSQSGVANSI